MTTTDDPKHPTERWLVLSVISTESIRTNDGKAMQFHQPGLVGFAPIFDSKQAAIEWANEGSVIEKIEIL